MEMITSNIYFSNKIRESHFFMRGKGGITRYKKYMSEALGRKDISDFRFIVMKCSIGIIGYLPSGTIKKVNSKRKHTRRVQDG